MRGLTRSVSTSFHCGHGALADRYAIPEQLRAEGVRRYGFHGPSYEYIAGRLPEVAPEIAAGRVIVAHLGSGASMCALSAGRSVESTMGFTALDGLPMGTRPGQIDPDVALSDRSEADERRPGAGVSLSGLRPPRPFRDQQ
jgi:acetate kinase